MSVGCLIVAGSAGELVQSRCIVSREQPNRSVARSLLQRRSAAELLRNRTSTDHGVQQVNVCLILLATQHWLFGLAKKGHQRLKCLLHKELLQSLILFSGQNFQFVCGSNANASRTEL